MTLRWEKLYPRKYQSDAALRACNANARGVWMELICIMYQSSPKGYLCQPNRITDRLTDSVILRLSGLLENEYRDGIEELERNGVFSRTEHGVIYCRHIVEESRKSAINAENGALGGNPRLTGGLTEPDNRTDEKSDKPRIKRLDIRDKRENKEKESIKKEPDMTAPVSTPTPAPAVLDNHGKWGSGRSRNEPDHKPKEPKKRYGGGDRVTLTETEFNRLIEDYGMEPVRRQIEALDLYLGKISPKKARDNYYDHNLTIRSWFNKDGAKKQEQQADIDRREHAAAEEYERTKRKLIEKFNKENGIETAAGGRTYEPTPDEVQTAIDDFNGAGSGHEQENDGGGDDPA